MSLLDRINASLKEAMKKKEAERLSTLRLLKSDLQYEMTATGVQTLSDEDVHTIIRRAIKKRQEAAKQFENAGRTEEAAKENSEMAVLKEFMPEDVSESEIQSIIDGILGSEEVSKGQFGRYMGQVMAALKGKNVDGALVKAILEKSLAARGGS